MIETIEINRTYPATGIELKWDNLRSLILKRDKHTCLICNCHESEEKYNVPHAVHHIDYDNSNNHPFNLATVCPSCHASTNSPSRRNFFKKSLENILKSKYNYEYPYFQHNREIINYLSGLKLSDKYLPNSYSLPNDLNKSFRRYAVLFTNVINHDLCFDLAMEEAVELWIKSKEKDFFEQIERMNDEIEALNYIGR